MARRKGPNTTLNDLADKILAIKGQITGLENDIKELKETKEELEKKLAEEAEKQGLRLGGGTVSRWSIAEDTVPQTTDWDEFCKFMAANKYWHLVQRRPGVTACQELWERGVTIPGIDKFTKVKVNVKGA